MRKASRGASASAPRFLYATAVLALLLGAAAIAYTLRGILLRQPTLAGAAAAAAAAAAAVPAHRAAPAGARGGSAADAAAAASSLLDARVELGAVLQRLESAVRRSLTSSAADAAVTELSASIAALRQDLLSPPPPATEPAGGPARDAAAAAAPPSCPPTVAAAAAAVAVGNPPPRRAKRVVAGLGKGIEPALLYRFVRSLRQHTSAEETDMVLFLHDGDAPAGSALAWVLAEYGVEVRRFDAAAFPDARWRAFHPSSYRWLLLRDWMRGVPAGEELYEAVLFADVRDVVFQADPFAGMARTAAGALAPAFYAFQEARPRTIAECGWNAGWVRDCFGDEGLRGVGAQVISCSGTSLATWAAGRVYAAMLADELSGNSCERNGADQGVHNFVVYGGRLRDALSAGGTGAALTIISNEEGWVGTVQSMNTLARDRAGRLLNARAEPYALVHQYDRSRVLEEQLTREYTWLADGELNTAK